MMGGSGAFERLVGRVSGRGEDCAKMKTSRQRASGLSGWLPMGLANLESRGSDSRDCHLCSN